MIPVRPVLRTETIPILPRNFESLAKYVGHRSRAKLLQSIERLPTEAKVMPVAKMPAEVIKRQRYIQLVGRRHGAKTARKCANLTHETIIRAASVGKPALQLAAEELK